MYQYTLLAVGQTNDPTTLQKETMSYCMPRLSVSRPVCQSHVQCLPCCYLLIKCDLISIYCISAFQPPPAQWALCACVPVPVGEPWNVFCWRLYCDNIFPSESQAALCSGATFPPPPTGHSLSVGCTASSHTKVPLKYQFVYSSVLNM